MAQVRRSWNFLVLRPPYSWLPLGFFYSDAVQGIRRVIAAQLRVSHSAFNGAAMPGAALPRIRRLIVSLLAVFPLALVVTAGTAQAERRIALVIGNAAYQAGGPLATPANDAGLIAQTLQAAGFDVVGARDLDQDSLRHAFRDFLEKASSSGPDTVAFVYVGGYGLQLEGENYFVPIDAKIARDSDIPAAALRISDYSRPLTALKLKAGIVVLDAARANPFAKAGAPLAGGLALVEPEPGLLIAFNSAPGTVAPEAQGPYGPYAQALSEMLREGGVPLNGVFERARLRVNEMTAGAEVPWHASKVPASLVFFERAADAPPPAVSVEERAAFRARPMREIGPQDGYVLALERDTLEGYNDFVAAYPDDPMAKRVRVIIAARREAITWRRTRVVDTPPAYWSYLRRYPDGPHSGDAHRRLAFLAAALEPPPRFAMLAYDLPPPPPEEIVFIRRPVLVFDDPVFGFAPPPPAPILFLAPPPPEFVVLAPPPPPIGLFMLPTPTYRPVPVWVRPPRHVAPPPANNVIYNNVHNTVVVNNVTNTVTVTNRSGQTTTLAPPVAAAPAPGARGAAAAAAAPVAAIGPSLPPSVAQKAVTLQNPTPPVGAGATPGGLAPAKPAPGQALPGTQGQPLPALATPGKPTPGKPTPGKPIPGKATPGTATPTATLGAATPGAATPGATTPGAPTPGAALPGTPTGTATPAPGTGKPGRPGARPAATASPSAAATPGASATPPAGATLPAGGAPTAIGAPTPPAVGGPKPATSSRTPAAKLTPPPGLPPPPAGNSAPPQVPAPAAKVAPPPPAPPPPPKPVAPPPARVVTPAPPPPPPPARVVTPAPPPVAAPPPPRPPAPAAAVARPAAPPACPPGKTAVVVNGQPTCK
jgi:uncharacterized caspase-like protein